MATNRRANQITSAFCTWFTRSKMGNVLAASPTNPSSSSNVASMPPPPPLTAPPPLEEKQQSAEKKTADNNNPGTYEDLHKACKGKVSPARWNENLAGFVDFPVCRLVILKFDLYRTKENAFGSRNTKTLELF